jgi:hypothetical protein
MSAPSTTTFVSRGRLNGVIRQRPARAPDGTLDRGADELDTQAYEAIYYRARLILGDTLPRPARLQGRGSSAGRGDGAAAGPATAGGHAAAV